MSSAPPRPLLSVLLAAVMLAAAARADEALPAALRSRVDAAATLVLARTGVPSASVAIVRRGEIAYVNAYGLAQLAPRRAATPAMRYAIGSISKQFTAAALLLLQEQHALSLEDSAGKWLENLGPAGGVSLQALLSHTSGIRDFWPQDYDPPQMLKPVTPAQIVAHWANQPLDFPSGTAWQYSNTGYTVAGLIAERAAQQPLFEQLRTRIFSRLHMDSAYDFDAAALPPEDAVGYSRYGLGPPRPAAKEGRGWLFAAGELAMTAADLARWDIALIDQRVLSEASYRELTREIVLANGVGSRYALGLHVGLESGRRVLEHGGEVGGFTAENLIYPDDRIAIVVLTNQDAANAADGIGEELGKLMLTEDSPEDAAALAQAEQLFLGLQHGHIDAALLTANARSYFTAQALEDFQASLGRLGKGAKFTLLRSSRRGGLITRVYEISLSGTRLLAVVRAEPGGLVEQYTVSPK
ncbi:MAG TPA: serine hydrolase domain-containing protein [Steroidobacteraceae bacterium]